MRDHSIQSNTHERATHLNVNTIYFRTTSSARDGVEPDAGQEHNIPLNLQNQSINKPDTHSQLKQGNRRARDTVSTGQDRTRSQSPIDWQADRQMGPPSLSPLLREIKSIFSIWTNAYLIRVPVPALGRKYILIQWHFMRNEEIKKVTQFKNHFKEVSTNDCVYPHG